VATTCVWDPVKAASNYRKHGVTFEEAATVLDDELVRIDADLRHGEARQVAVGMSSRSRLIFVVSLELDGDVIRLISARRATTSERRTYEEGE
jgi:uncharacterized DUF497 family protein